MGHSPDTFAAQTYLLRHRSRRFVRFSPDAFAAQTYLLRHRSRQFVRFSPDTFAAQTYNYVMEGFVRAISRHGTVHHSGA